MKNNKICLIKYWGKKIFLYLSLVYYLCYVIVFCKEKFFKIFDVYVVVFMNSFFYG